MRNESRRIILGGDLNARIGQDYEQSQVSRGSGETFGGNGNMLFESVGSVYVEVKQAMS